MLRLLVLRGEPSGIVYLDLLILYRSLMFSQWFELEYEYGPAWREIGKYLHWTNGIENLAAQYVNRALGLPVGHSPPPVSHCFPQQSTLIA